MCKRRKCSISEDVEDEDYILFPVEAMDLWVLFPLESAAGGSVAQMEKLQAEFGTSSETGSDSCQGEQLLKTL